MAKHPFLGIAVKTEILLSVFCCCFTLGDLCNFLDVVLAFIFVHTKGWVHTSKSIILLLI